MHFKTMGWKDYQAWFERHYESKDLVTITNKDKSEQIGSFSGEGPPRFVYSETLKVLKFCIGVSLPMQVIHPV